jgi:hypothetical protein
VSDYRSVPPPQPALDFVTVIRPLDATEGEIMLQVLRDHDIESRLIGTRSAAVIGAGPQAAPLRIEVPSNRVDQARALLDELRPPRTDDDDEPTERPRRAVLALGCVMLFFGGSHMYARRPWTAGVLAITQLAALFLRGPWPNGQIKAASITSILLLDAVMGVRAARAHNRGERPSPLRQALAGLAWVSAAATVGVLYALIVAR